MNELPVESIPILSPAEQLGGVTLAEGWTVSHLMTRSPSATGGAFSHGYLVENSDGRKGFLKAVDFIGAFNAPDVMAELNAITSAFIYERDLLDHCHTKRMDRVVRAITSGAVTPPGTPIPVHYLIFELADRDARHQRDLTSAIDLAWSLRALHHAAVGLQQLHRSDIAHQDLKPSNLLVFPEDRAIGRSQVAKLADLGRASVKGGTQRHDGYPVAGDPVYAPPELLYGQVDADFNHRRKGCDVYLLGSLVVFMFTGLGMTSLIFGELQSPYHPSKWGGSYSAVLPYVRDAFGRAMAHLVPDMPERGRPLLLQIVRELCDPDPNLRGNPRNRVSAMSQYALDGYVSKLDLLATKAEYGVFR